MVDVTQGGRGYPDLRYLNFFQVLCNMRLFGTSGVLVLYPDSLSVNNLFNELFSYQRTTALAKIHHDIYMCVSGDVPL